MNRYDPELIHQYLEVSEVLELGIDYYQCEDPKRTKEEAATLAHAYTNKFCKRWYSRDRGDAETRHRRAFDAFAAQVQEKRYFYSTRRQELDKAEEKAAAEEKKQAEREKDHQVQLENERKRVAALRERCVAKGLDFEKENIRQLKRRYWAQKIGMAVEAGCTGLLTLSIAACGYGDGGWESVVLCFGLFVLTLIVYALFCRPGKRLPDEAFEVIGKKKKEKK